MGLNASFSSALKARAAAPDASSVASSVADAAAPLVLLVDDEPDIVYSLAEQLRASCRVLTATSGEQALRLLAEHDVSLVVSDQRMPGMTGVDVLAAVRERSPDTVRVMLTGYADVDAVVEAINLGQVFLYLTKPWRPAEVVRMVRSALEHHRLLRHRRSLLDDLRVANADLERRVQERTAQLEARNIALEEATRKIEELVRRDPLTGAFNRRHLGEALATEVARARRLATPLAAIMVDLDHFKRVNDGYGHAAGDAVLIVAAARIASHLRPYDLVARYGGEEFVALLPGVTLAGAAAAAERLRQGLTEAVVPGYPERVTASLGVAALAGDETGEALLARADAALYRAKDRGRNRVECDEDGTP